MRAMGLKTILLGAVLVTGLFSFAQAGSGRDVVRLTNEFRTSNNLPALKLSPLLESIAASFGASTPFQAILWSASESESLCRIQARKFGFGEAKSVSGGSLQLTRSRSIRWTHAGFCAANREVLSRFRSRPFRSNPRPPKIVLGFRLRTTLPG